jgi:O-antigen ligase/ubiquinone/menaquinone biosynthesis C-methylase UbiE
MPASWERWPLILGMAAAPTSIAISESFLSIAALLQLVRFVRRTARLRIPRSLWIWLAGAALQIVLWRLSPEPALGWGEIRHMLLLAVMMMVLSAFDRTSDLVLAWKGVFAGATLSSLVLIGEFFFRLYQFKDEIASGGNASFYLRSGGLVHHWMVYSTIEIIVVAALISYWTQFPNHRRLLLPLIAINATAVVLSLTRMAWITCFVLLLLQMLRRRTRWLWLMPVVPVLLYALAPDAVRTRVREAVDLRYYSNAERLQMLGVGAKMVWQHPWTGVGPGRVEKLYPSYVPKGEAIPAYHGHLHNNFAQTLAQFGIPLTVLAILLIAVVFHDLRRSRRAAASPDAKFLSETAQLALAGFLVGGLFEYTYGHSLGLIMIAFAVFPPLVMRGSTAGPVLSESYVKEFYDNGLRQLSDSYTARRWLSSVESRFDYEQTKYALRNALGSRSFQRALEVGPGDGAWTELIVEKASVIDLLDQSEEMLKRAADNLKGRSHIAYRQANFADCDLPLGKYDLTLSVRCFEYISNKDAAVRRLHDVLAPGGTLVLITKSANYVRLREQQKHLLHTRQITRRDLTALFRKHGFIIDAIYPAVFRWKPGYRIFRLIFSSLHKLAVKTNGRARIPVLTEMATESYVYVAHKSRSGTMRVKMPSDCR